jgi:20S proteasome alpha/beta subunit
MANYNEMDNRDLLAASVSGDVLATEELAKRGNEVVTVEGVAKLAREILGSTLYNQPNIAADDVVTVTNGKITAVNGVPYP